MNEVIRLLRENRVMNLATSCDDRPRSSILEYGLVGNSIIFATFPGTIKGRNIAKNPYVSLTVGSTPTYVAIDGTVTEAGAKETEEYNKILFERHLLGIRHQVYYGSYSKPSEKYAEFKELLMSEKMNLKYYKIILDTAYYTHGTGPAKIIKMKE